MKAVIYARFSDHSQREESIEGQIRECKAYAEQNNMTIVETYIDRALSASKDTEKRLEFQRMIRDSAKGAFDVVLVWKLDRFTRSRYDSAHYKNILKKNGVKVVSATERITDSPEGIILESMLEGMAEYYSAELSAKIHRGQKENALKGRNNGGAVPLGYVLNKETQKLEIDPLLAPVVLEIFKRYSAGEGAKSIVSDLESRGIRSRKNLLIKISTLQTVLKNRKYIGEYQYQDVIIPDGIPAIVPLEIFEQVQIRVQKKRYAPASAKAKEEYLLTTKLFCGKCGKPMVGESGTARNGVVHHYYKCSTAKRHKACDKKTVKKDWVENLVVQQTAHMLLDDVLMERLINKLVEIQGRDNIDVQILKAQLSEIEKGIENILNAIQAGVFTSSTKNRLELLEVRKTDTENALSIAELKNPVLTREQISFFLYRFRKLDITEMAHRRQLIDTFVNAVYLYDDKILLTYNYKDGTKTIDLNTANGSDLEGFSPPNINHIYGCGFFICLLRYKGDQ